MIKKGDSTEKSLHDDMKGTRGVLFFVYCWEEGLTLLTVDNCPECNGFYREDRLHKKPRFDQRPRGPIIRERSNDRLISVHAWLEGRVSVHDRLGGRVLVHDRVGGQDHAT